MQKNKCIAIVLAGGRGKRMGSKVQKQYLEISGKPVLYYSLEIFQKSELIDEIILVVGEGQEEYCKLNIIEKYGFDKVSRIAEGGSERYYSVWNGLKCLNDEESYVFIHDGARPFVSEEIIKRGYEAVCEYKACVIGMPVKDTIKISDAEGFAENTPKRDLVWMIQTPQIFQTSEIKNAYGLLMERLSKEKNSISVTDDAMVMETMLGQKVKLVQGSYENIKITTPEDLKVAEIFLEKK